MSTSEPWWRGASLYQVYLRSFVDTTGSGYGDIPGVTSKLDYLSWLGVDGVWLSPSMPSPDHDWGYDVSDYFGVHPELGTMDDLERLISQAGDRNMRVLLDLVPNHSSDENAWFIESRTDPSGPFRDWYVWADPAPGGGVPNNWIGGDGQPAWTFDQPSGQYYLHNFLPSQPDFDWYNPEVHRIFEEILDYWFAKGVAGFRIDVANGLYKDQQLRDDPPAPVSPHSPFGLKHVYSRNRPEVHQVYRDWRRQADKQGKVLLGETWVEVERLAEFYGNDDQLHLGFNFGFVFSAYDVEVLAAEVDTTLAALGPDACPVWMGSNHDISRFPTRWAQGDPGKARQAMAILCTLPGATVLFNGDELGLTDVVVPRALQRDPMTWDNDKWNRDQARTPMPWTEDGPSMGFTTGTPWLPIGDRGGRSVETQRADPGSFLHLTRQLLQAKRTHGGHDGSTYQRLPAPPGCWAYRSGSLGVFCNFTDQDMESSLPSGTLLVSTLQLADEGSLRTQPSGALVVALDPPDSSSRIP